MFVLTNKVRQLHPKFQDLLKPASAKTNSYECLIIFGCEKKREVLLKAVYNQSSKCSKKFKTLAKTSS